VSPEPEQQPEARVTVRWCEACADRTARERAPGVLSWLRVPRYECVRCSGRREASGRADRRAWLSGRTIIDPL
jgi:hypothetical protein